MHTAAINKIEYSIRSKSAAIIIIKRATVIIT